MPTNLKKLVRTRMAKTGESYATALKYVRRRAEKAGRTGQAKASTPAPAPAPDTTKTRSMRYRGARRRDPAIDEYAASLKGPLGATVTRLVAMVRAAIPAHDELVVHGAPWFCLDGEPFCYLVGYTKHVNLGFCEGTSLADPDRLLEGTGKRMRHVKLPPGSAVPESTLKRLVTESASRLRARQAGRPSR